MPPRALFQYLMRRFIARSREVSKTWDWWFELSHCFGIGSSAVLLSACQSSERLNTSKHKSCCFKTSRDLTIHCLIGYWNRAQIMCSHIFKNAFRSSYFQHQRVNWNEPLPSILLINKPFNQNFQTLYAVDIHLIITQIVMGLIQNKVLSLQN